MKGKGKKYVFMRGFTTQELATANLDTPVDDLQRGVPRNGYGVGARVYDCSQLKKQLARMQEQKLAINFVLVNENGDVEVYTSEELQAQRFLS